jgi:CubicO group peptidase (beta-lactamase class C family)
MLQKSRIESLLWAVFLACLVVSTSFAQTAAQKSDNLRQTLQAKLDELHKNGKFPGATVGVALADGTSFGLAVGFSDRDAKTPMKPADLMMQGSVGKTYAAALALQLVKEGKINLDDKVEKYLGKEAWFSRLPNARQNVETCRACFVSSGRKAAVCRRTGLGLFRHELHCVGNDYRKSNWQEILRFG